MVCKAACPNNDLKSAAVSSEIRAIVRATWKCHQSPGTSSGSSSISAKPVPDCITPKLTLFQSAAGAGPTICSTAHSALPTQYCPLSTIYTTAHTALPTQHNLLTTICAHLLNLHFCRASPLKAAIAASCLLQSADHLRTTLQAQTTFK